MPLPDDDEEASDSDDSGRKSKMSFSYWGADKITLRKPVTAKQRRALTTQNGIRRGPTSSVTTYNWESSANAKFGTRLLSAESNALPPRPSSRRTGALPPSRQPLIDDTIAVKATVARPAWSENPWTTSTPESKRQREPSKPNPVSATRTPNNNFTTELSSPPEDPGIGMHRQVLAMDSSLAALTEQVPSSSLLDVPRDSREMTPTSPTFITPP